MEIVSAEQNSRQARAAELGTGRCYADLRVEIRSAPIAFRNRLELEVLEICFDGFDWETYLWSLA